MESKKTYLEEKRGIEPISENEYFGFIPLLIEHKHYTSEEEIITSELQRMKSCMVVLLRNKENRTMKAIEEIIERMDVYKKFLGNREDYLKTKRRSDMVYETFFDKQGNLILQESEVSQNELNAVQKVILLDQLGMIEHLRKLKPIGTSVNAIASVIAKLTNEKKTTIQPYLNQLISDNALAENKNPYMSKSSVEKIKNLLLAEGIELKKM